MKLVIQTQSTFFVEEDKILEALFDAGMDSLHLYKPDSLELYSERLLKLLPEDCHPKITVHQHYYLKEKYKLAGIHIDTAGSEMPNGYKGRVGWTCDNLDLLKDLKKKGKYVFLKSTFSHGKWDGEDSAFITKQLMEVAKSGLIDKHVYAMGGMGLGNIRLAKDLGFGGIVVSEDLWNRFDIHNEADFKGLIRHFEKLRKTMG